MSKHLLDSKTLGSRIHSLRKDHGFSYKSFAKEIGSFSVSAVQKWERGISFPSLMAVVAICNRFNLSVDELVLGTSTH